MRTKKVLLNSFVSVLSHFISFALAIITRKIFLNVFSIELIGYESLFNSLFTVLSIAEMGAGSMFSYMLFASLAKKDEEETATIIGMYRNLYQIIGIVIFGIGTFIYFLLPLFFSKQIEETNYLRHIYIIHLLTTVFNYYFIYRKAILIADQKSYKIVRVSIFYEFLNFIIRITGLLIFRNYLIYLIAPLIKTILLCVHCNLLSNKLYPYAFKKKATVSDFKKRDAFTQIKALLVSRIAIIIYSSTDPILISSITGISSNGLYSNYNQFNDAAKNTLGYFTESVEKSTGNLIYSESKDKSKELYLNLDFLSLYIGTISLCVCSCIFQSVIIAVYGEKFLLPDLVAIALGIDFYIRCRGISYCCFQTAIGHYEKTTIFAVLAAIINLLLSFVLGKQIGITGILIGTIAGNIFIQAGRARVAIDFIENKATETLIKELLFGIVATISLLICIFIKGALSIQSNILSIVLSLIFSILIPIMIISLIFFRSEKFKKFVNYCKSIITTIARK